VKHQEKVGIMSKSLGDVLTIEELSLYIKISKSTLYKLVREGKIPCQKVGRHWRFKKDAIDSWLVESGPGKPTSGASKS